MEQVKRFSLDMQFAKSQVKHDSEGELCFYRDYVALQQKLGAVLAENVALKAGADKCYDEITSIHNSYGWSVSEDSESETAVIDLEFALFVLNENIIDINTPATDAILNAVRAEAIDEFGKYHNFSEKLFIQQEAKKYAAQLRAGSNEGATHD